MSTPFSGRVVPWSARFRLAMALVLAGACFLLFFLGLAARGIRSDPDYRPALWTLLAGGAGFVGMWLVLLVVQAGRLIVDGRGVRIEGRTAIDLGRPRQVHHGRYDRPARRGTESHAWIAIEGGGRTVVIQRAARVPSWPIAKPPPTADTFDGSALELESLRAALAA